MVIFEVYERSVVVDAHSLALHFDAPFQNRMAPCQFDARFEKWMADPDFDARF